jgi:serine/threonine-protein kinase
VEAGRYRWFETAFWTRRSDNADNPFALDPGDEAGEAIAPIIGVYNFARVPVTIDQGDEAGFIERWLGWFASAILGDLSAPGGMPETSNGGFRRS